MFLPAIIIVAYNRPKSLKRLLGSVSKIKYLEEFGEIPLIVSIDHHPNNQDVVKIAEEFVWEYGKKEVFVHRENIGLRNHILKCGDLTDQYGSVIILEDDLFVSPYFYQYISKALNYFNEDGSVGGISLYHYEIAESSKQFFQPIYDGSDNYFMQFPSSRGQAWTKDQWRAFKAWYKRHNTPDKIRPFLWKYLRAWPETSWKKYYAAFLVDEQKYFVYPRISLSTNFGNIGTHHQLLDNKLQVSLQVTSIEYNFKSLDDSIARYDSFFELEEKSLLKLTPFLKLFSPLEVDLHGKKDLKDITKSYIITSKHITTTKEAQYGIKLRPLINNVIYSIPGDDIYVVKKENILKQSEPFSNIFKSIRLLHYHIYYNTGIHGLLFHSLGFKRYLIYRIKSTIKKWMS